MRKGPRLCQNVTQAPAFLIFGTRFEQTAPESVMARRTQLFTARCRYGLQAPHNMQNEDHGREPAADDKG